MHSNTSKKLKPFNTMQVDVHCKGIIPIYSEQSIFEVLVQQLSPIRVLGGGSNILFTQDVDAFILHNEIKGITVIDEDDDEVLVSVGSGENWHNLVMWSISHGLGGIENLALIPGTVGAAPIQNIGAYGVEQKDSFHSLKAIDLEEGTSKIFFREDCKFGYRDSIFKNEMKGRYFITTVNYIFSKKPSINASYGAVSNHLLSKGINAPSVVDMAEAIIEIRQSKLPDPKVLPNTGSFFKNPIIAESDYLLLLVDYPQMPSYKVNEGNVKIPAAWLIETAGFKGHRNGDAGIYEHHALVLVNHGNASGDELKALTRSIQDKVSSMFGINLEAEVNIW